MKFFNKIILLLILTACCSSPALAKVDKAASTEYIQLVSSSNVIVEEKGESHNFTLNFLHNRTNMGLSGLQHFYTLSIITNNGDKKMANGIIFNFNNPPKLELEQNGETRIIAIPRNHSQVWASGLSHEPEKYLRSQLLAAQKISLLLPCEDGNVLRLEVPEQAVTEWKYVISADMEAEQKALMG